MNHSSKPIGWLAAMACLLAWHSLGPRGEAAENIPPAAPASLAGVNGIYSIELPHFEPVLPDAPGKTAFLAACTSCHSTRYVPMQPRLTTAQWQAEVTKMIHVFGAHADTNQFQEIVSYLSVINGMATRPAAADDDFSASADASKQPADEPEPVLITASIAAAQAPAAPRGAALFQQDCAGCHGAEGRGNGVVGSVLTPAPSDLTAAAFSPELLSHTLWQGVPGTSMPSWRDLPLQDLTAVAAFVQTLHRPASSPVESPESLGHGRDLFVKNCAACHGVLGDARTSAAAALMPPPTNFRHEQPDFNLVVQVLRNGVPGTAMPIWKNQFSEADRTALAAYVRTLYAPNP